MAAKTTTSHDPHILHVPEDIESLNEAIATANKSKGKSYGTITTIILSPGTHVIDVYENVYGYDLDYVEVTIPLLIQGHPDQTNHKTIVTGGFLIKGTIDPHALSHPNHLKRIVKFQNLTISNSIDSGIYCFKGLGVQAFNVSIENCEGRGMVCQGKHTNGEFSGTILNCGMSGLCARDGAEITVSCKSDGSKTKITKFDENGLVIHSTSTECTCPLHIHPNRTRIESNCVNGYQGDYGLHVDSPSSKIHFLYPLTKSFISTRNSGGGNYGGDGVIDVVALKLRDPEKIYVPEESTTIAGAVQRAKESSGQIKQIVLKYGRHLVKDNYIEIDFSPLEIIGAGNDRTVVEGGGFKITGEKTKTIGDEIHVNKAIVIKSLSVSKATGSGIFAENGLPVKVIDCTIVGSSAYGICCQMTWMKVCDSVVENSGLSGVFAAYGGDIQISNPRSRVWKNCQKERGFDYGLRMHGKNSKVMCVGNLKKETVATGNLGGGNYGK